MPVSFLVVPQWQGSPSSRAMRLAEGAEAIREDLPTARTTEIAVPLEAGDDQGSGIARWSSVQLVRERLANALGDVDGIPVIVGGDCSVSAAGIAHAAANGRIAVVWFDAHPDLNAPQSSPSGAYAGMVLRSLIDDGTLPAENVLLAGARSWDPGEEAFVEGTGGALRTFGVEQLDEPAGLIEALTASGAESVYIHIDLDVLDPGSFAGLLDPEPFGLSPETLVSTIKAVTAALPLAGATLASYAPGSEEGRIDDAPTLLRIVGALAAAGREG